MQDSRSYKIIKQMTTETLYSTTTWTSLTLNVNANDTTRQFLISLLPVKDKKYLTLQDLQWLTAEALYSQIVQACIQTTLLLQNYTAHLANKKQALFTLNEKQKIHDLQKQQKELIYLQNQYQIVKIKQNPYFTEAQDKLLQSFSIDLTEEQLAFLIKIVILAAALTWHPAVTMTILLALYQHFCEENILHQIKQLTKAVADDFSKHFRTPIPEFKPTLPADPNPYHNTLTSIATPVPTWNQPNPFANASAPLLEEENVMYDNNSEDPFRNASAPLREEVPSLSSVIQSSPKTTDIPTPRPLPELKLPINDSWQTTLYQGNYPGLYTSYYPNLPSTN